jgi:hypothetical protein
LGDDGFDWLGADFAADDGLGVGSAGGERNAERKATHCTHSKSSVPIHAYHNPQRSSWFRQASPHRLMRWLTPALAADELPLPGVAAHPLTAGR